MTSGGYRAVDLIGRKRDGGELDAEALRWLVDGYLARRVTEGQMAALLMAGVLNGFTDAEARALTDALRHSGETLDLSELDGPVIDKHSTGGVGDDTTLIVSPLLAAAGAQVVKLSGRGLGHTGGTLDKLESIPGFRVDLSPDELRAVAADTGCVVAAQSERLVPGDRAIYALRDVTGTVGSRALIASSVMSKKLAGGADTIVLDVKCGDGAFMTTPEDARALAELCVEIGVEAGRRCTALVTAMDQPLGRSVGNALAVAGCVEAMSAPPSGRLAELALDLACHGLALARGGHPDATREELTRLWRDGAALERLAAMVAAQGGDPSVCDRPREVLAAAPVTREVSARDGGVVAAVPARGIGELAAGLGAGRTHEDDEVDPAVGLELRVEIGDRIERGAPLAVVHARTDAAADRAADELRRLVRVGPDDVPAPPTVLGRRADPR
ncbi:MAG: thymidine phosphorylase [Actinobacteria bacterium]|nr:thymidine phosphorylase [Actinomycetota bacterium]